MEIFGEKEIVRMPRLAVSHSARSLRPSESNISFIRGDARNISEYIKTPIDVTISSPPYYGMKDYEVRGQIGHESSYDEYLSILAGIFNQTYEKTRRTGSLWLILDGFREKGDLRLLPFDLATELRKSNKWKLQDIIVWNKRKTLPWSHRGDLRHIHEYILFFTKSPRYNFFIDKIRTPLGLKDWWRNFPERYNPNGKSPPDIWDFLIPTQGTWGKSFIRHFCPFPPELVERILLLTTKENDAIVDPFAGSGVVLAVSASMGRRAIGVEIKQQYIDKFHKKVFPEIGKLWKERKEQRRRLRKLQQSFGQTISMLRQIKFAKLLSQEVFDGGKTRRPLFIVSKIGRYSKRTNGDKAITCEIQFVYGKKNGANLALKRLTKACQSPPLSTFEISPKFMSLNVSELRRRNPRLWCYGNGSIGKPTVLVDFKTDNWRETLNAMSSKKTHPLIFSDKNVRLAELDEEFAQVARTPPK